LNETLFVFQNKSDDLKETPSSLEDLKFILRTISDIKDMSMDVETRIRDIRERYRTMEMYSLPVSAVAVQLI
jgi:dynein heavy chain